MPDSIENLNWPVVEPCDIGPALEAELSAMSALATRADSGDARKCVLSRIVRIILRNGNYMAAIASDDRRQDGDSAERSFPDWLSVMYAPRLAAAFGDSALEHALARFASRLVSSWPRAATPNRMRLTPIRHSRSTSALVGARLRLQQSAHDLAVTYAEGLEPAQWAQWATNEVAERYGVTHTCAECGSPMLPTTRPDWSADHETAAQVCDVCRSNSFHWSDVEREYIPREAARYAQDTGNYASYSYAVHNWYLSGGDWYETDPDAQEDSEDDDGSDLLDAGANPFNHFRWDKRNAKDALVFGVELEMETKDRASVSEIVEALGGKVNNQAICKSDGSLTEGVEFCTMPFTLEQHRTEFNWPERMLAVRDLAQSGAGTTSCGMHVHVNKRAVSALTLGKMLVFLNSESMSGLISRIAQRSANSYARRTAKKIADGRQLTASRYEVLNISPRHDTAEFRLFRGNLRPDRIIKNLEFCHATVLYCRDASMRQLEDWSSFSRWLSARRGQYPALVKFLADSSTPGFAACRVQPNAKLPRVETETAEA